MPLEINDTQRDGIKILDYNRSLDFIRIMFIDGGTVVDSRLISIDNAKEIITHLQKQIADARSEIQG